jgi:hypothetical protein
MLTNSHFVVPIATATRHILSSFREDYPSNKNLLVGPHCILKNLGKIMTILSENLLAYQDSNRKELNYMN